MPTDDELLRAYAEENSEAAFDELVRRQVGLTGQASGAQVAKISAFV